MTLEINEGNFDGIVKDTGIVVVDFYADWCGPCKSISPRYERMSSDFIDVSFGKLNVDKSSKIAANYNVRSIPTFIIFKDGVESKRIVGTDLNQITEYLNSL